MPDEFVTGKALRSTAEQEILKNFGTSANQVTTGKQQIDILMAALAKILALVEKSSAFGHGKKEDLASLARELRAIGSHSFQDRVGSETVLLSNWTIQQETFVKIVQHLSKVGSSWDSFADDQDSMVIEPLRLLKVSYRARPENTAPAI